MMASRVRKVSRGADLGALFFCTKNETEEAISDEVSDSDCFAFVVIFACDGSMTLTESNAPGWGRFSP